MRIASCALGVVLAVVAAGCDTSAPSGVAANPSSPAAPPPPPPPPNAVPAPPQEPVASLEPSQPAGGSGAAGVQPEAPPPAQSDPSLPVLGPYMVEDFLDEFAAAAETADSKYQRRRIQLHGYVTGQVFPAAKVKAAVSISPHGDTGQRRVTLTLDAPPNVKLFDAVVVEGDYDRLDPDGTVRLSNGTLAKYQQPN